MNPSSPDIHKTLDIIDHVHLEHPASALLRAFLLEAVQPQRAAKYLQGRLKADGHFGLLVADWIYVVDSVPSAKHPRCPSADEINAITKRDGGICCVTGKKGSFWDPMIVAPILPVPSAWLKGEFRMEHVVIDDEHPVDVNGAIALLGDHSRQGIEKVEARLIGSHARFCRSIQLVNLARTIAPDLFSEPKTTTYIPPQQFPLRMRSSNLGLGHQFNNDEDDLSYLLMSRVPGTPLAICRDALSDQDYANLSVQLKDCVSQMRGITKPTSNDIAICNTLGEACRDPRIRDWSPIGPFPDEAPFSQNLRFSDEPSRRGHKIVFTHGDLNPRNIMMERISNSAGARGWRLSGIIDWETAGYYPEYWDYTKSMFESFRWPRRHNDMMQDVFSEFGDYSEELAVERRAWESGDGI
ncbi:phosphotransferase family [Fusarium tjaetaba]|uniref:Phosphotransferase family n=1 Tax=Fusarium tjaetaba TaxID=1567544 RepID=A0A8H5VZN5_9HYPO|nr:phosphotransferase family [Fusarium tjaetaba]KAF5639454.1 phosphotransferase family [Fusarium tjaetaba]